MAENSTTHWTDDDELLSRFVLHRLSSLEEDKLAAHLRACEKCQQAVRNETQIAAGTKLAGRTEMKERLKSEIEMRERQVAAAAAIQPVRYQIAWTRIAIVAAVVVILIGVGIYNNWLQITEEKVQPSAAPMQEGKKESATQALEKDELAQSTRESEREISGEAGLKRAKALEEKPTWAQRHADEGPTKSIAAAPTGAAGAGVTADEARKVESEIGLADEADAHPIDTFWVEGTLLSSHPTQADELRAAQPERNEEARSLRKQTQTRSDKDRQSQMQLREGLPLAVSLTQKPASMLPAAQRYRQNQTEAIQTLIRNRPDSMHVTLYLPSLFPESELRSAEVSLLDGDSLVISLPSQRIGYRLPADLGSQVNMKAKQVK